MNERRPLLEENELFAKLVADAQRLEPRPEALQTLHRKLAAGAQSHAELATSGLRRWGWTALAGISCLAVIGALLGQQSAESISEPPSDVAPAPTVTAPPSPSAERPAIDAVPSIAVNDLPTSTPAPAARDDAPSPRPRSAAQPAPPSSASERHASQAPARSLGSELELIARAREALTNGDVRACLAAIDRHDREFPAGQFALEAKVMRIEAAFAAGDRSGARSLARDYLAANPSSPYDARIRSLLSSMEDR